MTLTIHFDGSVIAGSSTYAWRITDQTGKEIASAHGLEKHSGTNNIAEWAGLTHALRYVSEHNLPGKILVHGDSLLVINQLLSSWQCRKEHLQVYWRECQSLLNDREWTAEWIPRQLNKDCDKMSRLPI